jgi:hypothetical protein
VFDTAALKAAFFPSIFWVDPDLASRRAWVERPPKSPVEDERTVSMPRKGITGHDEWVVTEALATALIALEQLPAKHQPATHMDEIRKLLAAGCQSGTVNLHLAQAKCRLFPDVDREAIYREYGLEDGQA